MPALAAILDRAIVRLNEQNRNRPSKVLRVAVQILTRAKRDKLVKQISGNNLVAFQDRLSASLYAGKGETTSLSLEIRAIIENLWAALWDLMPPAVLEQDQAVIAQCRTYLESHLQGLKVEFSSRESSRHTLVLLTARVFHPDSLATENTAVDIILERALDGSFVVKALRGKDLRQDISKEEMNYLAVDAKAPNMIVNTPGDLETGLDALLQTEQPTWASESLPPRSLSSVFDEWRNKVFVVATRAEARGINPVDSGWRMVDKSQPQIANRQSPGAAARSEARDRAGAGELAAEAPVDPFAEAKLEFSKRGRNAFLS